MEPSVSKDMRCFGYYVVRALPKPDWSRSKAERILSVSEDGLSEKFPDLTKCFYTNYPERDRDLYRQYLKLTEKEFSLFRENVSTLFSEDLLTTDVRSVSADDAGKLSRFLKNTKGFKVVGLYTESYFMDEFAAEGVFDRVAQGHECIYPKKRMGCDILGCQYLGNSDFSFTSYMSGGLDEVIEERSQTPLVIDPATGLMLNSYDEAASFCSLIQGRGEPVIWTPFEIYEIMV